MHKDVIDTLEYIEHDLYRLARNDDVTYENLIAETHALREAVKIL